MKDKGERRNMHDSKPVNYHVSQVHDMEEQLINLFSTDPFSWLIDEAFTKQV